MWTQHIQPRIPPLARAAIPARGGGSPETQIWWAYLATHRWHEDARRPRPLSLRIEPEPYLAFPQPSPPPTCLRSTHSSPPPPHYSAALPLLLSTAQLLLPTRSMSQASLTSLHLWRRGSGLGSVWVLARHRFSGPFGAELLSGRCRRREGTGARGVGESASELQQTGGAVLLGGWGKGVGCGACSDAGWDAQEACRQDSRALNRRWRTARAGSPRPPPGTVRLSTGESCVDFQPPL